MSSEDVDEQLRIFRKLEDQSANFKPQNEREAKLHALGNKMLIAVGNVLIKRKLDGA